MITRGDTLRLLTQYFVRPTNDPRENRLTAGLVALLKQSDVLSRRILRAWLPDVPASGNIHVEMHRAVGSPGGKPIGWVDFEIILGNRLSPSVVVWVEVKLASKLSGPHQLENYLGGLRALHPRANTLVLLLAPAHRRSDFHVMPLSTDSRPRKDRAYFVTWQDVYADIDKPLPRRANNRRLEWLRQEVLGYMETEGLAKPSKITQKDVDALNRIDRADDAVEVVLEEAAMLIARQWHSSKKATTDRNYWEYHYPPHRQGASRRGWKRSTDFAWGMQPPDVFAGLYFDRTAGPVLGNNLWLAERERENDEAKEWEIDAEGKAGWVVRTKALRELARAKSASDQAELIAEFVLGTFDDLSKSVGPRPSGNSPTRNPRK